jgi:hypothetical protein
LEVAGAVEVATVAGRVTQVVWAKESSDVEVYSLQENKIGFCSARFGLPHLQRLLPYIAIVS